MKYKVGDKVRVKSLDWYNANKNINGHIKCGMDTFTKDLAEYCDKVLTIEKVHANSYTVNEAGWNWTDGMFEGKVEDMKEVKIEIPEGYMIDEKNSTFECIKFKKKDEIKITVAEGYDFEGVLVLTPNGKFGILDTCRVMADYKNAKLYCKLVHKQAKLPTIKELNLIRNHIEEINSKLSNPVKEDVWYWVNKKAEEVGRYRTLLLLKGSKLPVGDSRDDATNNVLPIINI